MPLPPPPALRLNQYGIADLRCPLREERRVLLIAVIAWNDRHTSALHQRLGRILQAHGADRGRRWTDENQSGNFDGLREIGIFREKAIARVNGLGVGSLCGSNNALLREIALARGRRADMDRFIGEPDVSSIDIGVGINGDRADAHAPCRMDDPAGDFSAIGDQYLRKHGHTLLRGNDLDFEQPRGIENAGDHHRHRRGERA